MSFLRLAWSKKSGLILFLILYFFALSWRLLPLLQESGWEHDSGWILGLARNWGEKGIYASFINTNQKPGYGAGKSIYQRWSLQDEKGFSYFPAAITVGPGYSLVEGLLIHFFGFSFWVSRLGPLLSFALLLFLALILSFFLAGKWGLLFFALWFWLYPSFWVNFVADSFAENWATLYLLSALLLYFYARAKKIYELTILAGIFSAAAILTKNITAVAFIFFLPAELISILKKSKEKLPFSLLFLTTLGLILSWFLYRELTLFTLFGGEGLKAAAQDQSLFFFPASGLDRLARPKIIIQQIPAKLNFWREIGFRLPLWGWLFFIFLPLIRSSFSSWQKTVFLYLWGISAAFLLWYLLFSPSGRVRHLWPALFFLLILFSSLAGKIINFILYLGPAKSLPFLLFFTFFCWALTDPLKLYPGRLRLAKINQWFLLHPYRFGQGLPFAPIIPLRAQEEAQKTIATLPPDKPIFYLEPFLVAEMATLSNRVFLPLRQSLFSPHSRRPFFLIFGPYQKGFLRQTRPNYYQEKIEQYCQGGKPLWANNYYTLCQLKS